MRENSENEEKLTQLIKEDRNVLKKLFSLEKIEDLKKYLESNDIYFNESELRKLYLVFQYFNVDTQGSDTKNQISDSDLDMSGGVMEIGRGLFDCLNITEN